ncbi:ECF transporter S component [Peribacillus loiseleuriae]|uniref:ECF transporter S component n=1 Tax=Peribacillus loiseleuriae TaxID=1679170 RepID=UPI003CFC8688
MRGFDLISGWTLSAPFTILTRGLQGYIVGKATWSKGRNGSSIGFNLFATIISVPFMLIVYYICEGVLFRQLDCTSDFYSLQHRSKCCRDLCSHSSLCCTEKNSGF